MATLDQVLARWEPVIGLEVHAQLSTTTKIFSGAPVTFDVEHPNTHVVPYCLGLPGTLPVLNRRAVELGIRAGVALGCSIRAVSEFSRKHYFYPDLPKGYQISQLDLPLCEHGALGITTDDGQPRLVHIARIHLEEDAGKNLHVEGEAYTLVDYNRAGVPLAEIVSAPDLRSAGEAARYLKALRAILVAIDVCDGNMEQGSLRADINVSLRPRGAEALGTRVEIKNVNSFRFVEQAIEHEVVRQANILEDGGKIVQETRLYDSHRRVTRAMRSKEEAPDYRYFPDPDLPPLVVPEAWVSEARAALPELPAAQIARWMAAGVPEEAARTFAEERAVARYFDRALAARPASAAALANLVKTEILRELKDDPAAIEAARLTPETLAELVALREQDKLSSSQQKKLLIELWRSGGSLAALLEAEGGQLDDAAALGALVDAVLAAHPKEVASVRAGKLQIVGFLMGKIMKQSGGKAKPELVRALLEEKLR